MRSYKSKINESTRIQNETKNMKYSKSNKDGKLK